MAGPTTGRRVTVDEAARHLGLSVDAIRKRIQRDQIRGRSRQIKKRRQFRKEVQDGRYTKRLDH
jgi:hypothetical protein